MDLCVLAGVFAKFVYCDQIRTFIILDSVFSFYVAGAAVVVVVVVVLTTTPTPLLSLLSPVLYGSGTLGCSCPA